MPDFDLAVIGAGPGGYVAAVRAAQLGLKTAIIERQWWGGVCLNVGCIPTKCLLEDSHMWAQLRTAGQRGVVLGDARFDFTAMQARKRQAVKRLTDGVRALLQKRGVHLISGAARFEDRQSLLVTDGESTQKVLATHFLIATGSNPAELPHIKIDHRNVLDSTDLLELTDVPGSLAIIGAGAIGLEMGSIFARLGTEVTVIEIMPQCLPGTDRMVASALARELKKQGLTIHLDSKVVGLQADGNGSVLKVEGKFEGEVKADKILLSVGRSPRTQGLGLEEAGVRVGRRGFIEVNERFQTSADNIYAVGDAIGGMLMAHKASFEGEQAVEGIAGGMPLRETYIPAVVYTWPEVATVGLTADEAKQQGRAVKEGVFSFAANGRALSLAAPIGFAKVVGDGNTDELLGVHILGPYAGELIAEATMALAKHASVKDYQNVVRAHPTLAESLHEAALAADGRAIHKLQ